MGETNGRVYHWLDRLLCAVLVGRGKGGVLSDLVCVSICSVGYGLLYVVDREDIPKVWYVAHT